MLDFMNNVSNSIYDSIFEWGNLVVQLIKTNAIHIEHEFSDMKFAILYIYYPDALAEIIIKAEGY